VTPKGAGSTCDSEAKACLRRTSVSSCKSRCRHEIAPCRRLEQPTNGAVCSIQTREPVQDVERQLSVVISGNIHPERMPISTDLSGEHGGFPENDHAAGSKLERDSLSATSRWRGFAIFHVNFGHSGIAIRATVFMEGSPPDSRSWSDDCEFVSLDGGREGFGFSRGWN